MDFLGDGRVEVNKNVPKIKNNINIKIMSAVRILLDLADVFIFILLTYRVTNIYISINIVYSQYRDIFHYVIFALLQNNLYDSSRVKSLLHCHAL